MAEVIEDDQIRTGYELGGVTGMDDVDDAVAGPVQDGDRAPDGGGIEADPTAAISEAVEAPAVANCLMPR